MYFLDTRHIRGPNLYTDQPVVRVDVDLGSAPSTASSQFRAVLSELIAALADSSVGEIVSTDDRAGILRLLVVGDSEVLVEFLARTALEAVEAEEAGRDFPVRRRLAEARSLMQSCTLGPSTRAVLEAAARRGIPCEILDAQSSLVRLGWGIHTETIQGTISSRTDAVAVEIATNKQLTKRLLAHAGLPVPAGRVAESAEDAVQILLELGPPVVLKPLDGNQGRGVSLNLRTENEVREAFDIARQHSARVIVEQLFTGHDYRVLVVDGKLVAASEKSPARAMGDGRSTIRQLIETMNADPKRGDHHSKPLSRVKIDSLMEAFLRRQGRDLDSVPSRGECVPLRDSANLSTGGEARDVTEVVHPEIRSMCERAATVIGLNICGLDMVLPDIQKPYMGFGGVIEANAAPGLRMHQHPSEGQPRDAGAAIVDMLFPDQADGRIPVIAVAGGSGKTTISRMIAHVFREAGQCPGAATTDGIEIRGAPVTTGDRTDARGAAAVLGDSNVEVAILELARTGVVESGLGFDWCDVAVLTAGENLFSPEANALLCRRVRKRGTLVMDADQYGSAKQSLPPQQVFLYSLHSRNGSVAHHVASGGSACVLHVDWIELRRPEGDRRVVRASALPVTLGGSALFQIANVLAAVGTCLALDLAPDVIASALMTFQSCRHNPGRMNVFEVHGGIVVVDRARTAASSRAVAGLLRRIPAGRRFAVLAPSDPAVAIAALELRPASGFERLLASVCPVKTILETMRPGDLALAIAEDANAAPEALLQSGAKPVEDAAEVLATLRKRLKVPA